MGEMFHIRRLLTLYGHIKTAEQRTIIQQTVIGTLAVDGGLLHLVQRGGPGRAGYQLHIIAARCYA